MEVIWRGELKKVLCNMDIKFAMNTFCPFETVNASCRDIL